MNATARLASALAVSIALSGCWARPTAAPPGLTPGCEAIVDDGSGHVIAWVSCPPEKGDRPESLLVECGTEGRFLGVDGPENFYARFKVRNGPLVWLNKERVKPLPAR